MSTGSSVTFKAKWNGEVRNIEVDLSSTTVSDLKNRLISEFNLASCKVLGLVKGKMPADEVRSFFFSFFFFLLSSFSCFEGCVIISSSNPNIPLSSWAVIRILYFVVSCKQKLLDSLKLSKRLTLNVVGNKKEVMAELSGQDIEFKKLKLIEEEEERERQAILAIQMEEERKRQEERNRILEEQRVEREKLAAERRMQEAIRRLEAQNAPPSYNTLSYRLRVEHLPDETRGSVPRVNLPPKVLEECTNGNVPFPLVFKIAPAQPTSPIPSSPSGPNTVSPTNAVADFNMDGYEAVSSDNKEEETNASGNDEEKKEGDGDGDEKKETTTKEPEILTEVFCGAGNFDARSGAVQMPALSMSALHLEAGDMVVVETTQLVPGTFVQ